MNNINDISGDSALNAELEFRMIKVEELKVTAIKKQLLKMGVTIDETTEIHRRFKNLHREICGDTEHIYYNDGSISGAHVLSIKTSTEVKNEDNKFSIISTITIL